MRTAAATTALVMLLATGAAGETLRVATYNVDLARDGPGLLLHELERGPKPQLEAVLAVIRAARPDVLLITRFDHDLRGRALAAFQARLADGADGIDYPFAFHPPVNAGAPSGRDLDGDGLLMGPGDALGWGRFPGNGGMALLSRLPIDSAAARTFRRLRWAELPGALLPTHPDGASWPDATSAAELRLSSRSHWDVPLELPRGARLHLLAANPTPPLFDGPERSNRRRNHDEIRFWTLYLEGRAFRDDQGRTAGPPDAQVVVLGDLNADPSDGEGMREGVARLLASSALQDPVPTSPGALEQRGTGVNASHSGPPARDTADWRDSGGPGNLRVDYVLPSASLSVEGAGVFWPAAGEPMADVAAAASDHKLVWVDIALP